jgi:hypothetical protein
VPVIKTATQSCSLNGKLSGGLELVWIFSTNFCLFKLFIIKPELSPNRFLIFSEQPRNKMETSRRFWRYEMVRSMSAKINLVMDSLTFIAFLVALEPGLTGVVIHEWLSLALAATLVLHIICIGIG